MAPLNSALSLIIVDPKLRRAYSRCVREVSRGLLPDLVNGFYDYLMIDLASIAYGLKDPRAFLVNVRLAIDYDYLRPSVVFVVDYSKPGHRAIAESRVKWLRELGLDYILAEDEPAEIKAAKECLKRGKCIVLSRDCNPSSPLYQNLKRNGTLEPVPLPGQPK